MSQQNVEVARRAFEAFDRADVDALVEQVDPEVEGHPEFQPAAGYVIEFKNGKAIRIREYLDPKEALEAVGLSE